MENMTMTEMNLQPTSDAKLLLDALYWFWDAFDRCNVPWVVVFQTAEDIMKNHSLSGDKIEAGINKNEWISGGRRLLDNFLGEPESESETLVVYLYREVNTKRVVPIELHIYPPVDCIIQRNVVRYAYEEFYVPNPYQAFLDQYAQRQEADSDQSRQAGSTALPVTSEKGNLDAVQLTARPVEGNRETQTVQ